MNTQSETPDTTRDQSFVDEAHECFTAFLQVHDCKNLLKILGIRRILFSRYKRGMDACKAVTVVLWYHALLRSFPTCAATMLETCIVTTLPSLYPPASVEQIEQNIWHLLGRMQEKGDEDFTVIADYLIEIAGKSCDEELATLQLKLVFYFRKQYAVLNESFIR